MSDDDSNNDIDDDIAIDQSCSLSDSTRRCTIYIVDAADKMFQYQSDGKFCDFKRALKIVRLQMVNKAVTSNKGEYISIIFINTVKRSDSVDNVVIFQNIEEINADHVKHLDKLYKSDDLSNAIYNICGGSGKADFSEVLFLCMKMIASCNTSFYKKVVYFFTNECQPFGLSERHLKSAAKNAEDLRKHGNDFAIFPLITAEQKLSSDFNTLQQLDPNVEENWENIAELEEDIPRKQYARRNICGIDFSLDEGLKFSVGIYSLIRPEKLPKAIALDAETNEVVQRTHIYVNEKTNIEVPLLDGEIMRRKFIGGTEVNLTAHEVELLRRLTPPGLVLLGFKPISCLKISHHKRSSQYVYPLESNAIGSTRLYRALYDVCLRQNKMIICRYTQKENVPPKLVALVPQAPVTENDQSSKMSAKFRYPGFHLVYLPFAEDKRDLSEYLCHPYGEWPKANDFQIDCARQFVRKLTSNYFPEKFANPVLQKHYKVIEAFALDYDDLEEFPDQTQPYFTNDAFRKRVETELSRLVSSTLPPNYFANLKFKPKVSKKSHHSDEISTKGKRPKLDHIKEMGLEELANNHMLNSLTITELKSRANEANITMKMNAKKAEIIDSIEKFYSTS